MDTVETKVVVPVNRPYKGGKGYRGPELRALQYPTGPYTPKVARILVRQLSEVNPRLRVKIVDYIKADRD